MHGPAPGVKPMQTSPLVVQKGIGPVVLVVLETAVVVEDVVVLEAIVVVEAVVVVVDSTTSLNAGTQSSRTDLATSTSGPKFVLFTDTVRGSNRLPFGSFAW